LIHEVIILKLVLKKKLKKNWKKYKENKEKKKQKQKQHKHHNLLQMQFQLLQNIIIKTPIHLAKESSI